jgi:hypothetical protein
LVHPLFVRFHRFRFLKTLQNDTPKGTNLSFRPNNNAGINRLRLPEGEHSYRFKAALKVLILCHGARAISVVVPMNPALRKQKRRSLLAGCERLDVDHPAVLGLEKPHVFASRGAQSYGWSADDRLLVAERQSGASRSIDIHHPILF